jgi:hypothetical protein
MKYLPFVGLVLLALAFGLWLGELSVPRSKAPVVYAKPVPETELPREYLREGSEPVRVVITPVQWIPGRERDTLRIEVPQAIAEDTSAVRISRMNPVTISRPVIGMPSVRYVSYNTATQAYETQEFDVPPSPATYGVNLEAYTNPLAPDLTLGADVYVGYRGVQPFVGATISSNGPSVRAGVRYRIGR